MSKKISGALVLLTLLCLCTGSFLPRGHAQTAAAGTAQNAAIVSTTAAVLKETSELRELSILKAVKSGAQSRAEIERMIVRNLDSETTPAEMHAAEMVLKSFGLAPENFSYRPFLIKLLTEQVAGYYDPKVQQFYLADWIELEGQKPVMAHELTHALQDQHFNLKRFENWPKGDSDAELAAHALIEGDATLAMTLYMAKNPLVALAFIKSLGSQDLATEQFKQAPRALRESLLFPYEEGSSWATQLYKRGGWEMVSKAFTKLPQSSEQILHADKYFSYEAPQKITLPEFKLGPGWKRIDYDVNGEWGCYLVLDEYLNDAVESKQAAAGWAGDRFALYESSKPGEIFIAQLTAWDTASDAKEFFDAYAKRTAKRYDDAKETKNTVERIEWQTASGVVAIELRGSRVAILEGVPASTDAESLLRTIWQQR
ncbi:MAG TPA: hypothetical protein VEV42_16960 [Pyrinomonadaceae bacterium]|nr:hypothetical protein [Pyrinomonadaceae bacterium]